MIIYVLGAGMGFSLVYGLMQNYRLRTFENENEKISKEYTNAVLDKKTLQKERNQLLENVNELKNELSEEIEIRKNSQKVNAVLREEIKKSNEKKEFYGNGYFKRSNKIDGLIKQRKEFISFCQGLKHEKYLLENKVNELKEQLKLEDEASCKIIKDLEDEIEKERALNQTYSGYIKYILNAPRAVRRKFINGECIDWYDENGVLRMKIKEEK